MDAWLLEKLSDITHGQQAADPSEVDAMLLAIRNPNLPLYERGLCCAALGVTMRVQPSQTVLRDISIMDSLIDMIGRTSHADPAVLGISSGDLYKIRVNCCIC